jgi:hypothetical protein
VVDDPGWVVLRPPGGGHTLNFTAGPRYVRPVWSVSPGDPQMMMADERCLVRNCRKSLQMGLMIAKSFFLVKIIHRIRTKNLRGKINLRDHASW